MNLSRLGSSAIRLSPLTAGALCALLTADCLAALYAYKGAVSPLAHDSVVKAQWRAPTIANLPSAMAARPNADAQTLTRPLFSKSRRAAPRAGQTAAADAAATTSGAPLPAGLNLKAIVFRNRKGSAFLACDALPEGKWIKEGDVFRDWTVAALHPLDVVLKNGERLQKLMLDYAGQEHPATPVPAPIPTAISPPDRGRARDAKGLRG
jgi:hypothetical protein